MTKKFFSTIVLIVLFESSFSQIGGISASKLATICTETVSKNSIEFEPSFGYLVNNNKLTSTFKPVNLFNNISDSLYSESGLGLRFTYGAINNLEIGMALPFDASELSFGAKYKLPFGDKLTYGVLGGINFFNTNSVFKISDKAYFNYVLGGVSTLQLSSKLSIDADFQFQKFNKSMDKNFDIFLNADFGYYVVDGLQLILGWNYFNSNKKLISPNPSILTLNLGTTIEKGENFILVLNTPIDVFGHYGIQSVGFGMALTIIIN